MLLIGNGTVITRDVRNTYMEDGAVCIKDKLIEEVGLLRDLQAKYPEATFVDAHGGLIMPGLINTHNHIYSAFARGLSITGNNPSNFLEILKGTWWRIDRSLTRKQVELSARATLLKCIKNGVTTVFDHHASYNSIEGSLFSIAEVAKEYGVRTSLCYEISDRDGFEKMKQSVNENIEFHRALDKEDDRIKAMIGMHASFTISDATLDYLASRNQSHTGYHIHVAEGESDACHCQETYHMSIIERLYKRGILGEKTIAAHCVHINEEDMDYLKDTNTMVVHNPESNMGNAVGCPDVLRMYQKGILLGLGTDGYTQDMMESIKVGNLLHKHNSKNPSAAWEEIPTMLFQNNKRIGERFFTKPIGVLERGAYADVIIADYHPFTPMNSDNINSHILFGVTGKDTITTIINGKVVMKDREFVSIDEEKVISECRQEASKLWSEL